MAFNEQQDAMRGHSSRRGFTLVEIAVALLILSLVGAAIAQIVTHSLLVYDLGLGHSLLEQETDLFSQQLERSLREARVISLGTSFLEFQQPVDHDDDGDVIDPSGALELGADGTLAYKTLYNVVVTGTFVEAERSYDLNRDGDMSDSLGLAVIEENIIDDGSPGANVDTRVLVRNVVTNLAQIGGDIDGDGEADPIFLRTDFLGRPDDNGRTLRIKILRVRMSGGSTVQQLLETSITSRQF